MIYTIRDIAALAGVSVTTVSRVLNHRPDVNKETRAKVEKVIQDCHFIGNTNARGLKQTDHEFVAIIIRGRSNPFLHSLSEAILSRSVPMNLDFITEYIDEKDNEFETACKLLVQKHIRGFIFVGSRIDERAEAFKDLDIPSVFTTVSSENSTFRFSSSVTVDDRSMGKAAALELLNRGHKKIAVFGGSPLTGDSLSLRSQGVIDAYEEKNLKFDSDLYRECRFTIQDGYDCTVDFFQTHKDVTALFAMSDMMAVGAIRALKDIGLRVPEDVSVIGFDGVELGQYTVPRLSTVRQPVEDIATKSLNLIMDMLEHRSEPKHLRLPAQLVLRESVQSLEE